MVKGGLAADWRRQLPPRAGTASAGPGRALPKDGGDGGEVGEAGDEARGHWS